MRRWCGARAELVPGSGLFTGVRGNPVAANIEAGLAAYREGGHDGVIAFGGGSALDAGKVIAFMSGQTRPLWDFEDVGIGGHAPTGVASHRSSRSNHRRHRLGGGPRGRGRQ